MRILRRCTLGPASRTCPDSMFGSYSATHMPKKRCTQRSIDADSPRPRYFFSPPTRAGFESRKGWHDWGSLCGAGFGGGRCFDTVVLPAGESRVLGSKVTVSFLSMFVRRGGERGCGWWTRISGTLWNTRVRFFPQHCVSSLQHKYEGKKSVRLIMLESRDECFHRSIQTRTIDSVGAAQIAYFFFSART